MNKWNYKRQSYEVDSLIAKELIKMNFLEIDSGNLETNETHYILNYQHSDKLRTKTLKINNLLYEYSKFRYGSHFIQGELLRTLCEIRTIELRKEKIKEILGGLYSSINYTATPKAFSFCGLRIV
jgi:hypothetical protein